MRRLDDGGAVGLHADRVDDGVRAPAVGQLPHGLDDVLAVLAQVQGRHAALPGPGEPFGHQVHADDPGGAAVQGDARGHVPDRAETEDGQGAARGNGGVLDGLPGGGQDVREVDEPLVGRAVGHLDGQGVAERHAQELGLPAGHLPVELAVAEEGGALAPLAHLGGLALRLQPLPAHDARAAGDVEGHDDAVARRERGDAGAGLLHDAHRLVAQDVARFHVGPEQLVQMQVRAADAGGGDPHDHVRRLLDPWVGDRLHADVPLAVPGQGPHAGLPRAVPDQCRVRCRRHPGCPFGSA